MERLKQKAGLRSVWEESGEPSVMITGAKKTHM